MELDEPRADSPLLNHSAMRPLAIFDTVDRLLPAFEPRARAALTAFAERHDLTFEAIVYEAVLRTTLAERSAIGRASDEDPARHAFVWHGSAHQDTFAAGAHAHRIVELIRSLDDAARDARAERWITRLLERRREDCERLPLPDGDDCLLHLRDFLSWIQESLDALDPAERQAEDAPLDVQEVVAEAAALAEASVHAATDPSAPRLPESTATDAPSPAGALASPVALQPAGSTGTAMVEAHADAIPGAPITQDAPITPAPPQPDPPTPPRRQHLRTAGAVCLGASYACVLAACIALPQASDVVAGALLGALTLLIVGLRLR